MDPIGAIPLVREAVVALMRYRTARAQTVKKGRVRPAQIKIGWGSGFCVVPDRYVVTACHVLTEGQHRDPAERFVAFIVPGNGDPAYHFPVIAFPLERPDLDLAILEIGPCATAGHHLPAVPVSFTAPPDGSRVLTFGFPAPEVAGVNIDLQGNYVGGQFFLKSHANEGILSAQYQLGQVPVYDFNVGWHHGESGGPVVRLDDPISAFTIMQGYRGIKAPHGVVAGPHRGCALSTIRSDLQRLGATVV